HRCRYSAAGDGGPSLPAWILARFEGYGRGLVDAARTAMVCSEDGLHRSLSPSVERGEVGGYDAGAGPCVPSKGAPHAPTTLLPVPEGGLRSGVAVRCCQGSSGHPSPLEDQAGTPPSASQPGASAPAPGTPAAQPGPGTSSPSPAPGAQAGPAPAATGSLRV